jgi:hypothetical protein
VYTRQSQPARRAHSGGRRVTSSFNNLRATTTLTLTAMLTLLRCLMLALLSYLCYEASLLCAGRGSGFLYLGWFGALIAAGFLSGFVSPRSAIWGAVLITCTQSGFVYERLDSIGELQNPSRSTGGMAEWVIVTLFLVIFSPVTAVASWIGCRLRRRLRPVQSAAAAAGAKPPPLSG